MKKAGILLAVLAAAILLKTQVWDRLTRPSAAENNLDRAYSITEIQSAADDLYSGFGLLPEGFDWEAACRESYYQAAEAGSEYDYYLELCRLTAQLQDGHTTVIPPKGSDLLGNLPLALCHIEGEYYVRETLEAEELPLLSRLTKVNGSNVHAYFQGHIAPYVGVQTPDTREERWANFLCTQGERGSEVTLEFELPDGTEKELIYTYKELGLFDMGGHESQPVFQCGEEQLYDSDAFGLYRLEGGTPTEESILVVPLCTGYAVTFSGSRQIASDGTDIQNNRVQPRIEVPVSLEAFRTGRDACLERAAEELEQMASGALAE